MPEEKDECLQTAIPLIRAAASNRRLSSWQTRFDKRTSAAVCDKGRNQREWICDEGVGLCGESQVSNDFLKIVDKIPDDRGWNRGKPGVNSVTLQRGVSESLRICLQSSYSRLCGGALLLAVDVL